MSKHDPRKGLSLRLPDPLRRRLVATTSHRLPLAHLLRLALRRAMTSGTQIGTPVQPGTARPILLQLSGPERAALEQMAARQGIPVELAILSLVDAVI